MWSASCTSPRTARRRARLDLAQRSNRRRRRVHAALEVVVDEVVSRGPGPAASGRARARRSRRRAPGPCGRAPRRPRRRRPRAPRRALSDGRRARAAPRSARRTRSARTSIPSGHARRAPSICTSASTRPARGDHPAPEPLCGPAPSSSSADTTATPRGGKRSSSARFSFAMALTRPVRRHVIDAHCGQHRHLGREHSGHPAHLAGMILDAHLDHGVRSSGRSATGTPARRRGRCRCGVS